MIFDLAILGALILLAPFSYSLKTHLYLIFIFLASIFIGFYYFYFDFKANISYENYFLSLALIDYLGVIGLHILKSRKVIISLLFISMLYNELTFLEYQSGEVGIFYNLYSESMMLIMLMVLGYGFWDGKLTAILKRLWIDFSHYIYNHVRILFNQDSGRHK